jgi:hypothetical protein
LTNNPDGKKWFLVPWKTLEGKSSCPAPWLGVKAFGVARKGPGSATSWRVTMAKYGSKASEKVEKAMHERKKGTLKSGSGKKVKSRKQAIAIGLSQARKEGGKVPSKKSSKK